MQGPFWPNQVIRNSFIQVIDDIPKTNFTMMKTIVSSRAIIFCSKAFHYQCILLPMRNPGLCQMSGAATFSIFSPSPSRLPRHGSATTAIDDINLGRWELSYTKDAAPVTTIVRCGPNTTPTLTARTLRLLHTVAQAAVVVAAHCGWVLLGKGGGGGQRWAMACTGFRGGRV